MVIYDLSYIVILLNMLEFRALPGLYSEFFIIEIESFSDETSKTPNPKSDYNFFFVENHKETLGESKI